jgi:hypothetical protein
VSPLRTPPRIPRIRAFLFAALFAALLPGGCATTGAGRPDASALLTELFPGDVGRTLRGEAEVTLSLAGRSVSMPGALLLGGSGNFRIDLLDPLDRPAAIIFTGDGRIVQYRPAAREAAALAALPAACGALAPDVWVPYALGSVPSGEQGFEAVSWFGKTSLVRYERGRMTARIEYAGRDGAGVPTRISWFCGDEIAMRLRWDGGEAGGSRGFTVEYPLARLKVKIRLGESETGIPLPEALFRPPLPAGTRWTGWDLVGEERGGAE